MLILLLVLSFLLYQSYGKTVDVPFGTSNGTGHKAVRLVQTVTQFSFDASSPYQTTNLLMEAVTNSSENVDCKSQTDPICYPNSHVLLVRSRPINLGGKPFSILFLFGDKFDDKGGDGDPKDKRCFPYKNFDKDYDGEPSLWSKDQSVVLTNPRHPELDANEGILYQYPVFLNRAVQVLIHMESFMGMDVKDKFSAVITSAVLRKNNDSSCRSRGMFACPPVLYNDLYTNFATRKLDPNYEMHFCISMELVCDGVDNCFTANKTAKSYDEDVGVCQRKNKDNLDESFNQYDHSIPVWKSCKKTLEEQNVVESGFSNYLAIGITLLLLCLLAIVTIIVVHSERRRRSKPSKGPVNV